MKKALKNTNSQKKSLLNKTKTTDYLTNRLRGGISGTEMLKKCMYKQLGLQIASVYIVN